MWTNPVISLLPTPTRKGAPSTRAGRRVSKIVNVRRVIVERVCEDERDRMVTSCTARRVSTAEKRLQVGENGHDEHRS
jgi:hypothetical protein